MPIDHDQIFKQLIEAFFREFMELFCPDEAALIDFSKVEFLREEHFTDIVRVLSASCFVASDRVKQRTTN